MRRAQSSSPISSSSVRCGCQYFQSCDPLPERRTLVGTPIHFRMADHEYEPISPPGKPEVKVTDFPAEEETSPKSEKKRVIRIPNSDQVIIPLHGESDEEINPDRYKDGELSVEEVVEEDRNIATPTTTTQSRTDAEVHTSQVDSSALEHLPLDKASRQGTFGTRIRSQAGKIRSKLRNIQKPNIKFPDRPKIKLPDRPKIKMPETPKFLTEKPKFLTEKPKFLTERPKFTMPERPKFLRERPKFKMPERPKFPTIDRSKLPTMPKFDFRRKQAAQGPKKTSSLRRPLKDHVSSVMSESGSSKNGGLFQSFTYPRFLRRYRKDKGRVHTPPPRMETLINGSDSTPKWMENYRDLQYADDTEDYSENVEVDHSGHFHERYPPDIIQLDREPRVLRAKAESTSSMIESDKEQQSSGSSSVRRRKGVIEEISSDEFFVREKGLSREDVDVSRYLTEEIRDAFRSPKNALARVDAELYYDEDYDQDEPELQMHQPKVPERKRSRPVVKRTRSRDSFQRKAQIDSQFHTFPMRPTRRKQSEPSDIGKRSRSREMSMEKPPRKTRSKPGSRQASLPSLPVSARHSSDAIHSSHFPRAPSRRRSSREISKREQEWTDEMLADEEIAHLAHGSYEFSPVAPVRKTRSRGTSLADEDRTSRGVESLRSELPFDDVQMEELPQEEARQQHEYIKPGASPIEEMSGYAVVNKEKPKPPRPPPPPVRRIRTLSRKPLNQFRTLKNHGINFFFTYPRRAIRSLQKTAPPVRPTRNYSTLGPSRPPRRSRVFREPVYVDGEDDEVKDEIIMIEDSPAKESKDESDARDLERGDVIEKMKSRPLPPPPRPTRKRKDIELIFKDLSNEEEQADDEEVEIIREERVGAQTSAAQREDIDQIEEVCPPDSDIDVDELERQLERELALDREIEEYKASQEEALISELSSRREEFLKALEDIKPPERVEEPKVILVDAHQQTSFEAPPEPEPVEEPPKVKLADMHQQTSFDVIMRPPPVSSSDVETSTHISEATVSVQTDPLPENVIVEEPEPVAEEQIPVRPLIKPLQHEPPRAPTPPPPEPQIIVQQVIPEKVHLSEIDVEKINVSEIQTQRIIVSDVHGQTMQVSELTSRGGNLVVGGVELPQDFIQNLATQIRESLPQPQPQVRTLVTPTPPIVVSHTTAEVALPPVLTPSSSPTPDYIPQPKTTKSRGRKTQSRVIDDSEDELAEILPQRSRRGVGEERESPVQVKERLAGSSRASSRAEERKETPSEAKTTQTFEEEATPESEALPLVPVQEPSEHLTSRQLIGQLMVLWQAQLVDMTRNLVDGVNRVFPEGEKRHDAQTAACILLVLVAGLILLGCGLDSTVHHHHWDYVPPR